MAFPVGVVRAVGASLLLGAVLAGCAAPATAQDPAAGAVHSTTAAANAPHPLTTLPGVRVGVQVTAVGTRSPTPIRAAAPTTLPALPTMRTTGTLVPPKAAPAPVRVAAVDGCNRAYGTASQCIPLLAPGGKPVTCAYLRSRGMFAKPLIVVQDPLGLLKKHPKRGVTPDGRHTTISGCTD